MSITINVDEDLHNADWPKRTNDADRLSTKQEPTEEPPTEPDQDAPTPEPS